MARICAFADEFGNFDFSLNQGASQYFGLTTVTFFDDQQARADLEELRFELAWDEISHPGPFRASTDRQSIRNRVFETLQPHDFRVDATILEKRKAQPQLRTTEERFYGYAWYCHMERIARQIAGASDDLLVVAASIGAKSKGKGFHYGVRNVMERFAPSHVTVTVQWPASVDVGLQIADHCSWAIQRKWERGDERSYILIKDRIETEVDIFRGEKKLYY